MDKRQDYIVLVQGAVPDTQGYDMQFLSKMPGRLPGAATWGYTSDPSLAEKFDVHAATVAIREYRNVYGEHHLLVSVSGPAQKWTREARRDFLPYWKWKKRDFN